MTVTLPAYDVRDPAPLTMPRERLKAIQDGRLRTMVGYVYETSSFNATIRLRVAHPKSVNRTSRFVIGDGLSAPETSSVIATRAAGAEGGLDGRRQHGDVHGGVQRRQRRPR